MWCRVLLFVIALTCTFQREITADTDDVLCVVILSGLQKEDLDTNMLAKLKRHNVNIDDINNRKNIERCILRSSSDKREKKGSGKAIVPTKSVQQSKQTRINSNINENIKLEDLSIENQNNTNLNTSEIENNKHVESRTIPSYEKFIKLWKTSNNTSHQDNQVKPTEKTEKDIILQLPVSSENETKIDFKTTSLNFINKILKSYISATKAVTTTIKPTTDNYQLQNQVDNVSQQIMKFLKQNNVNHNKTYVRHKSEETKSEQTSTSKINYIVSETVRIEETSKHNEDQAMFNPSEIDNGTGPTLQNPSFENFINLWIKLNKTNHQDNKGKITSKSDKSTTVPAIFAEETKSDSKAKGIDLMHKMLGSYLSRQAESTTQFTTTESEQTSTSKINDIVSKTVRVEEMKDNEDLEIFNLSKIENGIGTTLQKPSYENLINLWIKLNKTNYQDNKDKTTKKTGKITTVSTIFAEETERDSEAKGFDLIHKMLESYLSQQVGTATQSTTTESEQTSTRKNNFVSKTVRVEETSKDNEDLAMFNPSEIENGIGTILQNPSFENFINLLIKLNKTNHQDNKEKITKKTGKSTTISTIFAEETKSDSEAKSIDLIHKMLESYLSQQIVITTKSTTTEKTIDILSQQIKEFLKNSNTRHDTAIIDRTLNETYKNRNDDETSLKSNSDSISNQLLPQKYNFNIPVPFIHNFEDVQKLGKNLQIVNTKKNMGKQIPNGLIADSDANPHSKYINMLKDYFAAKYVQTSTQIPTTTTPQHIDMILQKINEFFEKKYTDVHKVIEKDTIKDTTIGASEYLRNEDLNAYKTHPNDQGWFTRKIVSIESNNELRNQYQSTIPGPYETNSKDEKLRNLQFVQAKDDIRLQLTPVTFNNKTKADSRSKELDYIFHMFETYIARKDTETTTSVPTTTPKHIDVIAQKLKEYLESNDNKYRRIMGTTLLAKNQIPKVANVYNTDSKLLVTTRKINHKDILQKQANKSKVGDSNIARKNLQQNNNSKPVEIEVFKKNKLNDNKQNKEAKTLSEDVIRALTEKIKESVLKDLQKQMFTTLRSVRKDTKTNSTTTKVVENIHSTTTGSNHCGTLVHGFKSKSGVKKTTTELPSTTTALQINQNKIKTASNSLENFIELYKQFNHVKNCASTSYDLQHAFTPQKKQKKKGKTKNEFHDPINLVNPTLSPQNYSYKVTHTVSPIFVNPYGIHINNPMAHKTRITNEVQKFHYGVEDPWNFKESNMNHAMHAAVIQTDDAQVPLLGIPVPESISPLNQNIMVTTKHPMIQIRQDREHTTRHPSNSLHFREHEHTSTANLHKPRHQGYSMRGYGKYDTHSDRQPNIDIGQQSDPDMTRYYSDMERAYGRGSYLIPNYKKRIQRYRLPPRSRQANFATDHFFQEFLSNIRPKSDIPWDHGDFLQERKRERFHEKLERPDDRHTRHRNLVTSKKDKRVNVAPRQQLSMNYLKKKKKDEDSLYRNFMKSQQKVNDMLEKMLKPTNRVRSVEAI